MSTWRLVSNVSKKIFSLVYRTFTSLWSSASVQVGKYNYYVVVLSRPSCHGNPYNSILLNWRTLNKTKPSVNKCLVSVRTYILIARIWHRWHWSWCVTCLGHFERPSWPFRVYSAYRQLSHYQLTTNIASVRGLGFFLFSSQEVGCEVVASLTVPYFSGSSSILVYTNID